MRMLTQTTTDAERIEWRALITVAVLALLLWPVLLAVWPLFAPWARNQLWRTDHA